MKPWYCEYCNGAVRLHDYLSILIGNFPIFAIRRYDWDLHTLEKKQTSTYLIGFLGFTKVIVKTKYEN